MRYVCPRCKGISNSTLEVREDKPKDMPKYDFTGGHWSLISYGLNLKYYLLDHWNRTVVCKHCGEAHHFFKDNN